MASPLNPLLLAGVIHDSAASPPGDADVDAALAAHRERLDGPHGDVVGPLLVRASQVDAMRGATLPDEHLQIALVADEGLLGLVEARHAVQDDPWTELTHVHIAVPDGFDPAEATRALLAELSFTVPTYVELPRTGFEPALDVLADDGVERAAYRCCGSDAGSVPTDGELASFVHGAVTRNVPFVLMAGPGHVVHGGGEAGTLPHHGLLNVLAAVAASLDGASTTRVAELLATATVDTLLDTIADVPPLKVRDAFQGYACTDVTGPLQGLADLGLAVPLDD